MASNMSNAHIEFRKDGSKPICIQTHTPRQNSELDIYYLCKGEYAKPFRFSFQVSKDLKKLLIRFYNPFEKQWFEKWVDR